MRLTKKITWYNEVNFEVTYDGHQKSSKYSLNMFYTHFDDLHRRPQNWPHYAFALTSLCQVYFFMNLIHSWAVWLLTFDTLKHFLHFDIFLTFWQMTYYLNHLGPSQGYFCCKNFTWCILEFNVEFNGVFSLIKVLYSNLHLVICIYSLNFIQHFCSAILVL